MIDPETNPKPMLTGAVIISPAIPPTVADAPRYITPVETPPLIKPDTIPKHPPIKAASA